MKDSIFVKQKNLTGQLENLVPGLIRRVPFLEPAPTEVKAQLMTFLDERFVDGLIPIEVGGRLWVLIMETKNMAGPRVVRTAVLQLQHNLRQLPAKMRGYGVVIAPFISAESARICTDAGVGYADLVGNARLTFGNVYIEMREAGNPLREKRELRSLFGPQAAQVLRVLLQEPQRPWRVVSLAKTAGVSLGWVSAVRRKLLAQEWAEEREDGLVLTKPDTVVAEWTKSGSMDRVAEGS